MCFNVVTFQLAILQARRMRLIDAKRLFLQVVAGGGKSAGAAAHADIAEFATAAFSLQVARIAELVKYRCALPYFGEGLMA